MAIQITTEPVPLKLDNDGVIRVGGTRVTLDTEVAAFNEGATTEEVAADHPSLNLADVYAVISYYLRKRADVDAYLSTRQQLARQIRQQNETRFNPHGIRDRLLARRSNKKTLKKGSPTASRDERG